MTWDAAAAHVAWAGVALPTEAQWERAARAGHDDFVSPWGVDDGVKRRNGALDRTTSSPCTRGCASRRCPLDAWSPGGTRGSKHRRARSV